MALQAYRGGITDMIAYLGMHAGLQDWLGFVGYVNGLMEASINHHRIYY